MTQRVDAETRSRRLAPRSRPVGCLAAVLWVLPAVGLPVPALARGATRQPVALPAAASSSDRPYLFRSPTGNINCAYFPADGDVFPVATVSCEVLRFTGTPAKRPNDCDLDGVASATLTARNAPAALWSCQGDTIAGGPDTPTLAYGKSITRNVFRCSSSSAGIRCDNIVTKRGFQVSSRSVTRF
jgi:hypothetical protein